MSATRQATSCNIQSINFINSLMLTIFCVEMGRQMIVVLHIDYYTEEGAYTGHGCMEILYSKTKCPLP
jgi:hypothetical protein